MATIHTFLSRTKHCITAVIIHQRPGLIEKRIAGRQGASAIFQRHMPVACGFMGLNNLFIINLKMFGVYLGESKPSVAFPSFALAVER
jgi:hypothetical protein